MAGKAWKFSFNRFMKRTADEGQQEQQAAKLVPFFSLTRWRLLRQYIANRRLVRKYQRAYMNMSPAEQLVVLIDIVERFPHLRRGLRQALGIEAKDLKREQVEADRALIASFDQKVQHNRRRR